MRFDMSDFSNNLRKTAHHSLHLIIKLFFINLMGFLFMAQASQANEKDREQLRAEIEAILQGAPSVAKNHNAPEHIEITTEPEGLKRQVFASHKPASEQGQPFITGATGLPLPRYVSLKSDQVNVRIGPGQDYEVDWRFIKKGLPVEITMEFENWRRVRDSEGEEGWVYHALLSGKRTAILRPWDLGKPVRESIYKEPSELSSKVAFIEPNVLVHLDICDQSWCKINVRGHKGWIEKDHLWGVYPDEVVQK